MLRKLVLSLSVFAAFSAHAQKQTMGPREALKATQNKSTSEIDYKQPGAPMPPVRLIVCHDSADHLPQEVITNEDLKNRANLFILIFNPTCSHCQDETRLLEDNMSLFKKSRLVFSASPQMKDYVQDFLKLLHTKDYPLITVGIDSADYQGKAYLYQMLPQINIYDRDRKLLKIFNGHTPIDSLKEYIQ